MTLPDYVFTEGGADTITLAAGHTGADHVAFYAGNGVNETATALAVGSVGAFFQVSVPGIAEITSSVPAGTGGTEVVNSGWWGIGAGASSADINVVFTDGTGTSVDQSSLTGFNGGDILDFSGQAWGSLSTVIGLTDDTAGGLENVLAAGDSSSTGTPVIAVAVAPGGSIATTGANLIELSQGSFLNANAVAAVLANGSYNIGHSTAAAGSNYDFLIAYQGLDGNVHIADLHILGGTGGTTTTATDANVNVSDMVTLVGVSLPQLNFGHVHLVT